VAAVNFNRSFVVEVKAGSARPFEMQFYGMDYVEANDASLSEMMAEAMTRRGINPSTCSYSKPRPDPVKARQNVQRKAS
jgi:hypothetical protein